MLNINYRGAVAVSSETPIEAVAQSAYDALQAAVATGEGYEGVNRWQLALKEKLWPGRHGLTLETADSYRLELALGATIQLRKTTPSDPAVPQADETDTGRLSERLQTVIQQGKRIEAVEAAYDLARTNEGTDCVMKCIKKIRSERHPSP